MGEGIPVRQSETRRCRCGQAGARRLYLASSVAGGGRAVEQVADFCLDLGVRRLSVPPFPYPRPRRRRPASC